MGVMKGDTRSVVACLRLGQKSGPQIWTLGPFKWIQGTLTGPTSPQWFRLWGVVIIACT